MRIVKAGTLPRHREAWWFGLVQTCTNCGAEYVLEPCDEGSFAVVTVRSLQGTSTCASQCPTCGLTVKTTVPNSTVAVLTDRAAEGAFTPAVVD